MFWVFVCIFFVAIIIVVIITIQQQKERDNIITESKITLQKQNFQITKEVKDTESGYSIVVDDSHNQWAIINARRKSHDVYKYSDLIEYEVIEDGNSIVKGRVGSVIVGGLLFGGLGALAGSARSKKVKSTCRFMSVNITLNNLQNSQISIPLITSETKTDSFVYNVATAQAKEFASVLAIIKSKAEQEKGIALNEAKQISSSDEIEKLYNLKEKGIITEFEFEQKKKQILNL